MKFSSVSFSEDSSPKLYQMCGQILTFPERKVRLDTQHGDHIQQNQLHVNVLGDHHKSIQPDWKKKHYSRWLLSITWTRVIVPTLPF